MVNFNYVFIQPAPGLYKESRKCDNREIEVKTYVFNT